MGCCDTRRLLCNGDMSQCCFWISRNRTLQCVVCGRCTVLCCSRRGARSDRRSHNRRCIRQSLCRARFRARRRCRDGFFLCRFFHILHYLCCFPCSNIRTSSRVSRRSHFRYDVFVNLVVYHKLNGLYRVGCRTDVACNYILDHVLCTSNIHYCARIGYLTCNLRRCVFLHVRQSTTNVMHSRIVKCTCARQCPYQNRCCQQCDLPCVQLVACDHRCYACCE